MTFGPYPSKRLISDDLDMPVLIALGVVVVVAGAVLALLVPRYHRDIQEAGTRLRALDRTTMETRYGTLEYADTGKGDPLLVSHGIFHGCDGGLLSVRDIVEDRRVIAPSRFGYLASAMPPDATAGDQGDAFVALLDHLHLDQIDVIGISAGTGAAVQVALRHPERIRRLVISSGNWPGSPTAAAPPDWAKVFYTDRAMWSMKALAPPMMRRLMGVPKGFPKSEDDARRMAEMLDSVFPIGPRRRGAIFDAFVSNPDIDTYPLEDLSMPVLLVHAADDPLASYEAAERAAERIPDATLIRLDSGGHLGLGQSERIRDALSAFLSPPEQP